MLLSPKSIKTKIKERLFRNRYPLYAFLLAALAFLIASVAIGIAPFGKKSILVMDLWGQYYPMIVERLRDPFGVWSWSGSLGYSAAVQNAYYTNSLFNYLLLPFQGEARIAALNMITFLKAALSAFSFAYYLERRKDGIGSPLTTALGTAYGLSAYLIAFISQPMWLDAVLFLPLVLLGLERMLSGRAPWLYVAFLTLTLYSNFYIGFAVCIFTTLWFFVTVFSDGNPRGITHLLKDTGKFAAFSLASGALSAFALLPVVYGMKNWISSTLSYNGGDSAFHPHELWQIADNLSMGIKPSLEFGVANLYCGSAALFFALLFVFNGKISWKKRLSYTAAAAFLMLSFELKILDYFWHGLHFPNQLPGRQSFLFAFVLLLMAHETLSKAESLKPPHFCVAALLSGSALLVGLGESKNKVGRYISVAIIFLAALILLFRTFVKSGGARDFAAFILAGLIALDSVVFAVYSMGVYGRYYDTPWYVHADSDMAAVTKKYESGKNELYRSEMTRQFTFNPAMLYGFKGISYYSSTMNGNLYRTFEELGNRVYAQNVSTIYQPTPIQDMMFGVRYHYGRENILPQYYGEIREKVGNITVVESRYPLPIAYAVEEETAGFTTAGKKPFAAQNEFLSLATGIDDASFAAEQEVSLSYKENAVPYTADGKQYFYAHDSSQESILIYSFRISEEGPLYLDIDFVVGNYTVRQNGTEILTGECYSEPLRCVASVKKGDQVDVSVTVKGYAAALCGVTGYVFHEAALSLAHRKLSENVLQITKLSKTRIRGTIAMRGDMLMYSSIPAGEGWRVYVDGKEVETIALNNAFLCFSLPAGEHTVEYRYSASGLTLGVILSLLSAASLGAYDLYSRKKRKKEGTEK